MEPLRGVYTILTTPFTPDGELDESSLRRLLEATVGMGIDGITILGVAGEAQKLTAAERRRVVRITMAVTAGRVPILVGTSHDGTDATITASREAMEAGATGFMIAPPTFVPPGPVLTEHYQRIARAVPLPIVLQDFPPVNGVTLSPRAMAELVDAVPAIATIKLEDTPTPQRVAQTLALLGDRPATILGGLGGVYLLDELRRGSSGTMTGFAFPEVLVAVWRAWQAGDRLGASKIYYRYLPLLVFEGQPRIGLAVRKELLRRRGLIASAATRHPGPKLDAGSAAALDETLAFLDMEAPFEGFNPAVGAVRVDA